MRRGVHTLIIRRETNTGTGTHTHAHTHIHTHFVSYSILTRSVPLRMANLTHCRQARESQQHGQSKKDDSVQTNPNGMHLFVLVD
jgi:hypothetical protein